MWQVQSIHKCSKCGSTDNKRESRIVKETTEGSYQVTAMEQSRKCNECGHEKTEGLLSTWTRQHQLQSGEYITIAPLPPPEYVHLF